MKRLLLSVVLIFLSWMTIDTLSHNVFFASLYKNTPNIWRPIDTMNPTLIIVVTLLLTIMFVITYKFLVRPKSILRGLAVGGLIGVALGISSGFGTYIHSPISITLAWSWFVLGTIKGFVAGAILGWLINEKHFV